MSEIRPSGADEPDRLQAMLDEVSTPEELRLLLGAGGVDDALITEFATEFGVDRVLDRVFALMGTRFLPEKARDARGTVRWDVQTPEGERTYQLAIDGTRATGSRGAPAAPTVTLRIALPNLLRLCSDDLNGVTAVMTGKMKITGDLMFGAKMAGWFDYT
ncbi:SCP2 sterol-binding domain-containing protein [Spirillospora sp. CA-294931]|uniref:SCP2 sterol-binding domain-containing protein n=1 Tax=Spirillospora sp. CA-294931 TaxID=3240042 RepID=UPI003D93542B